LLEFGVALPQGLEQLCAALQLLLEPTAAHAQHPPGTLRTRLEKALRQWAELDARIDQAEAPITQHAREDARARMVGQLQGIGLLGASALVAHQGAHLSDMSMFTRARQTSAWLGVVPAQHSSRGKVKLSGISKHGDSALRTLLITGARSAVQTAHLRSDPTSQWLTRLRERSGWQKACVALVNKNLRIAWAMLTRGTPFDPQYRPTAPARGAAAQPQPMALPA
jgi:transposase